MTTDKQRATSLLQHYLRLAVTASGQRWDSDNNAEVEDIVDSIIDACNEPTQTTASTPAEPDMIQQAGQLLAMLQAGKPICHGMSASSGDDRAIVQASAALAIAGELREIRNILADGVLQYAINTMPDPLPPCEWIRHDDHWHASCGLLWIIEDGTSPAANDMRYCPNCGSSIAVEEAFIGEDGAV